MSTQVRCPQCDTPYRLQPALMGKQVHCRKCSTIFQVPAGDPDVHEVEPIDAPARLPMARVSDPGPAVQKHPDAPSDPDEVPDLVPGHLRSPRVRRAGGGPVVWGLAILGGLLFVGMGYAAARLWFLPAARATVTGPQGNGQALGAEPGLGPAAPAEAPGGIKPVALAQDKVERPLPGAVRDLAVGGGGRFLVLHLSQQRQLALFDANEGKITRYLPVGADNVKFAGGRDKLIVVLPDQNLIQRWDLHTGQREVSAPLPFVGVVKAVALGSNSSGPLLVHWAENTDALANAPLTFLDLATLRESKTGHGGQFGNRMYSFRDNMHFRASADGSVIGAWCTSHTPQGIGSFVLEGDQYRHHSEHDSAGHIVPGPDGKFLYTAAGIFTNQVKRVGGEGRRGNGELQVPAHHGLVHVGFRGQGGKLGFPGGEQAPARGLSVYLAGNERPLLTLPDVEVPAGNEQWTTSDFTVDKRIHVIPAARLIVVIPASNDRLVLHRFDLDAALEKSGIDFLVVTSQPPAKAPRGQALRYPVTVKSKQGGLKFKVEAGPPGLTVSPSGLVNWTVPPDAPAEVSVILSVGDKTGQEVFHTFKLRVE